MICPKGGFPTLRHNEVRDITADLLTETCNDVAIEPQLQPLHGETFQHKTAIIDDHARLDISARGIWQHSQRAFFDERVFYPNARSNMQSTSLASAYKTQENEKKREYGKRVREIENATFTPLVFAATGGVAEEASIFYKRIAELISIKTKKTYTETIKTIRCRLSFSLIRSAILCIRGSRTAKHRPFRAEEIDIISSEVRLTE